MIVLIHIIIALMSLACSSFAFISPSKAKVRVSYSLVAATFVSGTYLVVTTQTHMLETCTMGLAYIGATLAATVAAGRKLAHAKVRS